MKNWGRNFLTESETLNAFSSTFGDNGVKYLLLDFDDTVRHTIVVDDGGRPPIIPEEVSVFHGVGPAIRMWQENGWKVFGTSNQKGPLRRRHFVPDFMRKEATLDDAAYGCGKIMQHTLDKLGVDFPVYFCSYANVYHLTGGKVNKFGTFGTEDKKGGQAPKPNPSMGQAIIQTYGQPNLSASYMVGDDFEGVDSAFAGALGFKFIHPGKLGRDFIAFTERFFGEEGFDESQSLQQSYGSNKGYNQYGV